MHTLLTEDPHKEIHGMDDMMEMMARRFYADCYLFDWIDEGKIIGCRCPSHRECLGKSVLSFLDEEAEELMRDALHRFDVRPLVVSIGKEIGLILPGLIPSSALGVLLIPHLPSEVLLSALKGSEQMDTVWQSSVWERYREVRPTRMEAYREELTSLLWEIACFCTVGETRAASEWEIAELTHRALVWAHLVGYPISFSSIDVSSVGEYFDVPMFDALLLTSLLLCRRISSTRTAVVTVSHRDCGETVSLRIPVPSDITLQFSTELHYMRLLADRNRIPADYLLADDFLYLSFTPVRLDWSYLGIKQPDDLTWFFKKEDT